MIDADTERVEQACAVQAVVDAQITCKLAARASGGFGLAVTVNIDGQSTSANLLSFRGPSLTAHGLQLYSGCCLKSGSSSAALKFNDTNGGQTVQVRGKFFGTDVSQLTVSAARIRVVPGSILSRSTLRAFRCTLAQLVRRRLARPASSSTSARR